MTAHCEWCPFPGCDSCAYKGHERHLPPAPTGLTFTAYGIVAGQGSKRHVGNGVMIEQSKRVKPWRAAVQDAMLAALAAGGRLVEERRQPCSCGSESVGPLRIGHLLADAHTSLRERARYVTHWREVPDA